MENDKLLVLLAVWVFPPKFSGMLELHEILRVPHVVSFPIVFNLFYEATWQGWQGEVFQSMINGHFSVFLAVWVLLPKFLSRLSDDLH